MAKEYTFDQFVQLDDAAKAVLVAGVATLRAYDLSDESEIDTFEAKITSDFDSLPKTTFTELKARSEKALLLYKELTTLQRTLRPDTYLSTLEAIKSNIAGLGVTVAAVVGAKPDY